MKFAKTALWLLAALIIVWSGSAYAGQNQEFRVTTSHGAVVRAQPTTTSEKLAIALVDMVLPVVAVQGDWVEVSMADGKVGYIFKTLGFVEKVPATSSGPSDGAMPPATATPTPASVHVVTTPTPKAEPKPKAQVRAVPVAMPVKTPTTPGQFGVGAELGVAGGIAPSVLYDMRSRPLAVRGLFDFGTGYSAFAVQGLYRFKNAHADPNATVSWEPFIGAGLTFVNLDFGVLGSQSVKGFVGSGGVFFTLKSLPSVRFSAEIDLPVYNTGNLLGTAVYGTSFGLGAHYFFSQGK